MLLLTLISLQLCRIETVGEERARHMSESAAGPLHWTVGRRKRAATLGSEVSPVFLGTA